MYSFNPLHPSYITAKRHRQVWLHITAFCLVNRATDLRSALALTIGTFTHRIVARCAPYMTIHQNLSLTKHSSSNLSAGVREYTFCGTQTKYICGLAGGVEGWKLCLRASDESE